MSAWSFAAGVVVGFELVVLVMCGAPIRGRRFSYRRHFWWTHVEFWAPWWEAGRQPAPQEATGGWPMSGDKLTAEQVGLVLDAVRYTVRGAAAPGHVDDLLEALADAGLAVVPAGQAQTIADLREAVATMAQCERLNEREHCENGRKRMARRVAVRAVAFEYVVRLIDQSDAAGGGNDEQ